MNSTDDDESEQPDGTDAETLPDPASLAGAWELACTGGHGEAWDWVDGFESLGGLQRDLRSLEGQVEPEVMQWPQLLHSLDVFRDLPDLSWPPLYSPSDFQYMNDDVFLEFTADSLVDLPGMTFTQFALYVATQSVEKSTSQAAEIRARLKASPFLRDVIW